MNLTKYPDDSFEGVLNEQVSINGHYLRVSVISLIVGTLLIGGLSIWHAQATEVLGARRPMTMLEHAGGILLSAANLENHIPLAMQAGHHRYWLGASVGDSYTTNCVRPGVLEVDYFGPNQSLSVGSQPVIRVTAYESLAVYNRQPRPLSNDSTTVMTTSRGDSIAINMTSLTQITILPKSSHEVITIDYSTPQTVLSMMRDSESLVKL